MFNVGDSVLLVKDLDDAEPKSGTVGKVIAVYRSKFTKDGLIRNYPYDVIFTGYSDFYPVTRDEIVKHED